MWVGRTFDRHDWLGLLRVHHPPIKKRWFEVVDHHVRPQLLCPSSRHTQGVSEGHGALAQVCENDTGGDAGMGRSGRRLRSREIGAEIANAGDADLIIIIILST